MAVSWTYDGASQLSATFPTTIGLKYTLITSDVDGTPQETTAVATSTTLTIPDIGGLAAGETFFAVVKEYFGFASAINSPGAFQGATVFAIGDTDEFPYVATWNYDGDKTVEVQFTGTAGNVYYLETFDSVNGGQISFTTATGSLETLQLVAPATYSTDRFCGVLTDTGPIEAQYLSVSDRLFVGGVASAGDPGNPESSPEPEPCSEFGRFFGGYDWRFIVTDLDSATLTILDRLCTDRRVTAKLGAAWEAGGTVPSGNPEINILRTGSGTDAFLQEGISLIYGFRRDGANQPDCWTVRFGGVCLGLRDVADTDLATSEWRAFDPWTYLYSRPLRDPDTGELPGAAGLNYNTNAEDIVYDILNTTILYDGECYLDINSGQFDTCPVLDITFQRGASVGEALDTIMATDSCEIMFTPIYDPVVKPGYVAELNVAPMLGQDQPDAIMAWDKPSRSLVGLDRNRDGTRRTNVIQFYAGQGGTAVAQFDDATSVAKFGVYFEQMFIVGGDDDQTEQDALRQLSLRSYGAVEYQVSPATDRSPVALLDYMPGDTVPVYASTQFREELAETLRVMEIPIEISDNAEEQVRGMTVTPIPVEAS